MIIVVVLVVVAVSIFVLCLGMLAGGLLPFAPGYGKADRYLKSNIDELDFVADALLEFGYDQIQIRGTPMREEEKYSMSVRNGNISETVPIPYVLLDHIKALYKSGVDVISCGSDFVDFSMWSSLSESRGITYSRTGKMPDGEQLIEVIQLSRDNWYYYVHNYEKAKARNPHLFH